ncbi:MAG TPA: hypothetical protein VGP72_16465 [Planctomycetota bacterium]|jgi:hypothetical protein
MIRNSRQNNTTKSTKSAKASKPMLEAKGPAKQPKKESKPEIHPICSGGLAPITEAVGTMFRAEAKGAPQPGDTVLAKIGNHEVVLIVSHIDLLKSGSVLVHSWIVKGSGDHKILGEAKGKLAQFTW